jgi:hypothetical protein
MVMAETRRRQLSGLRKMAAARVRRRICLLRASQRLEVRRRLRSGSGKAKTVSWVDNQVFENVLMAASAQTLLHAAQRKAEVEFSQHLAPDAETE